MQDKLRRILAALEAEGLAEDTREWLFEVACYSTRWFDSLFGDDHDFKERRVGGRDSEGSG